jgi:hypothetical protein
LVVVVVVVVVVAAAALLRLLFVLAMPAGISVGSIINDSCIVVLVVLVRGG